MKLKSVVIFFSIVTSCYLGMTAYHYFFDQHKPTCSLQNIEHEQYYAHTINGILHAADSYKLSYVSILIDNNPLIASKYIGKPQCAIPFTIDTTTLTDGKHSLSIELTNGIYHSTKTVHRLNFYVDNKPLHAQLIYPESECKIQQGKTLHVKFQTNKALQNAYIQAFNKKYVCFPEADHASIYESFIPIDCEQKPDQYLLRLDVNDVVGNTITIDNTFQVLNTPFKKQQLKINAETVKREKENNPSNDILEKELAQLAQKSPAEKLWYGIFYCPTEIQSISTEFGAIRTTQEKGRYMHKAIDIVNTPKSVVWAPQDGIVIIKNRYAFSGNTVVIDHGFGIFSLLYHLDNFADGVEIGMRIKQGNPIGTLGKTGYASGYHLHWEMRIDNIAVDPLQWTDQLF